MARHPDEDDGRFETSARGCVISLIGLLLLVILFFAAMNWAD